MVQKAQDLIFIEKCLAQIQQKQDIPSSVESIKRTLQRRYDLIMDINIISNNTNTFFGMTIYPSSSTMDKMVDAMLNDKSHGELVMEIWKQNKSWILEIDSIALYDINLNANPAELTAMLIHEIGHIVYSNTIPQRVNKLIKFEVLNLTQQLRELCKKSVVNKLFELAIIEACNQKNYDYMSLSSEIDADKFVVKEGYGEELDNFISKLLAAQGNSMINKSNGEKDKEVEIMVKWAIDNITEIKMRKTKLRHLIDVQILKTPSEYVKDVLTAIRTTFTKNEGDAYKESLAEQNLFKAHDKIVAESFLDFIDHIGKIQKINQVDVDILSVQIEKIDNQDDKIYMLDQVYDKLELVNAGLKLLEEGKTNKVSQSKQTLLAFKVQLEKMRGQIMETKVKEKQYGLFIKYPAGYEG